MPPILPTPTRPFTMHIPAEILEKIFSHLVLPGFYEGGVYRPHPEGAISRGTLTALARSDKRFNKVATDCLYGQTVVLNSPRTFFLFLRTIVGDDELAEVVRVLWIPSCPWRKSRGGDAISIAKSESIIAAITSDQQAHRYLVRCFGDPAEAANFTPRNRQAQFGQSACCLLFCLTSNVETLSMALAWDSRAYLDGQQGICAFFNACDSQQEEPFLLLPSLRSLSLFAQGDEDNCTYSLCCLAAKWYAAFLGSGTIKHLELDEPDMGCNGFRREKLGAVESLRCTSSLWLLGDSLLAVYQAARPPLRILDVTCSVYGFFMGPRRTLLGESLERFGRTLEKLRLRIQDCERCLVFDTGLVPRLARFEHVRELVISVALLFSSSQAMESTDICTVLPTSLEKVRFDEIYYKHCGFWGCEQEPSPNHGDDDTVRNRHGYRPRQVIMNERARVLAIYRLLLKRDFLRLLSDSRDSLPRLHTVEVAMIKDESSWSFGEEVEEWLKLLPAGGSCLGTTAITTALGAGRYNPDRGRMVEVETVCYTTMQASKSN